MVRRALISIVLVAVTVVVQLTVVSRIAFLGGAGPDLVLILVAALGLASGPMAGVLTGFWGGLALDVAPPGSHFVGQDALVFCLIGYSCGLLAEDSSGDRSAEPGHTALFEILVTAAGAVCGEALVALLGVMLSDPRVTWPAITNVLPAAVAYDALLCPFVLYAAAAALRLAGARGEGQRTGWSPGPARAAVPGASQGAIRQVGAASTPRLRLADRGRGPASLGRSAGAAFAPGGLGASQARVRFGGRRREGVFGGSLLGSTRPGALGLASSGPGLGGSRLSSSRMGMSLLGGSVFSRSSSAFGRSPSSGRLAPLGRPSPFRHRASLMSSPRGGLTGHAPRFSRGSSLDRLTGVLRRSAGPKSPGRRWLRGAGPGGSALGRNSLGRNSLGGRSMSRKAFGRGGLGNGRRGSGGWAGTSTPRMRTGPARLHMPRPSKSRRGWRTGGYR